ncbi:MAG: N-(5'-phosphoribosyl)anthranilate isomerase [Phycisphaerales bacterium JB063]
MTRTRIKICGIREEAAARAAVNAGADAIGLVFVASSPRAVDIPDAARVVGSLPPWVEPVGLFVDAEAEHILQVCRATGVHSVQLHGREPLSLLDSLPGLRVIKALPFDPDALDSALAWDADPRVSALLFDAAQGGSGETIDWHALAAVKPGFSKPIILAGGLSPGNVAEAIEVVGPYAVDVSSGVEASRGEKDAGLIDAFCKSARLLG